MTPEGKVKAAVNKVIDAYGSDIYKFMPVPSGYGASSLDYILCIAGVFVAVETKAPGKKPTPRQEFIARQIKDAGGKVFVISDEPSATHFIKFLNWLLNKYHTPEEIKAWPNSPKSRSAPSTKR